METVTISTKNGENVKVKARFEDNGDITMEWTDEMIESGNILVNGIELKDYIATKTGERQ